MYVSDINGGRVLKFINQINTGYTTLTPGDYTAEVFGVSGCSVITNVITVTAPLIPQVSVTSNTNIACVKFQPLFTASPTNGGATPLYQWKINGVNYGGNTSTNTFTNTALKAGDLITCVLTNNESCVVPATVTSTPIQLIAPTEFSTVVITANNPTICKEDNITFTANPTNAGASPVFTWKVNGIVKGMGNIFSANNFNNGDQVTCEMIANADVCQANDFAVSNAISVNINPTLIPSIIISADQVYIFKGGQAVFTAAIQNGGTAPVYIWKINGKIIYNNGAVFTTSQLNNGDIVTCEFISNALCTTRDNVVSNTLLITVVNDVNIPNTFTPNGDGINDT